MKIRTARVLAPLIGVIALTALAVPAGAHKNNECTGSVNYTHIHDLAPGWTAYDESYYMPGKPHFCFDDVGPNSGPTLFDAGAGKDWLMGRSDSDQFHGSDGVDTLIGGDGADFLGGGAGNDNIWDGNGADTIRGTSGYDTWYQCADGQAEAEVTSIENEIGPSQAYCNGPAPD